MEAAVTYPRLSGEIDIHKTEEGKILIFNRTTKKTFLIREAEYKILMQMDGTKDLSLLSALSKVYSMDQMQKLAAVFRKIGLIQTEPETGKWKKKFVREGLFRFKLGFINANRLLRSESLFVRVTAFILVYLSLLLFAMGFLKFYFDTEGFAKVHIDQISQIPFYMHILSFFLLVAAHELGHAIVTRSLKIPVPEIGILFYLFFPLVYTNISFSRLLRRKRDRLKCMLGGIYANMILAGLALWFCGRDTGTPYFGYLLEIASMNILLVLTNLIVFFKLDGYFILQDILGIPYFYENNMRLVTGGMQKIYSFFSRKQQKEKKMQASVLVNGAVMRTSAGEEAFTVLQVIFAVLCILYLPFMLLSAALLFF